MLQQFAAAVLIRVDSEVDREGRITGATRALLHQLAQLLLLQGFKAPTQHAVREAWKAEAVVFREGDPTPQREQGAPASSRIDAAHEERGGRPRPVRDGAFRRSEATQQQLQSPGRAERQQSMASGSPREQRTNRRSPPAAESVRRQVQTVPRPRPDPDAAVGRSAYRKLGLSSPTRVRSRVQAQVQGRQVEARVHRPPSSGEADPQLRPAPPPSPVHPAEEGGGPEDGLPVIRLSLHAPADEQTVRDLVDDLDPHCGLAPPVDELVEPAHVGVTSGAHNGTVMPRAGGSPGVMRVQIALSDLVRDLDSDASGT